MSKLTLHVQSIASYLPAFVAESGTGWIKVVDPPEQDPFPGVKVIGRMYMPDEESNALIWQGAVGADQWLARWLPVFLARPYVHCWEGPNEPQPMADSNFRSALDAFTARLSQTMAQNGLCLVGHNWSVGWPDVGHAPGFANSLSALWANRHYLGLHQYSAPTMQDNAEFLSLRHRRTVAELCAAGIPMPQIIIGECGIDGGVIGAGYAGLGWQYFCDEDTYLDQLKWWDSEIKKDAEVVTATIFTVCDWDWHTFHVPESLASKLASYIASDEEEPPVTEMARGIDVSEWQGAIDWSAVAASGIKFAIIRASVCKDDGTVAKDRYFDRNWSGAKATGILRGAYHYLNQLADGQSLFFVNAVGDDRPELGYWADLESASLTSDKCKAFLNATDKNAGETCHVYTRASFVDRWGIPVWAPGRKLWVAHWDATTPTLPKAWNDWEFWQHTSKGAVSGIVGNVDLNWYNGTEADLATEYGDEEPLPVPATTRYFDSQGVEQTESWWRSIYGDGACIERGTGNWHIVELHDSSEPAGMDMQIEVCGQLPVGAWPIIHWADGATRAELKESTYWEVNMWSCYAPPDTGPYWLTLMDGADELRNFGWLCETNHRHPQKVVYAEGEITPPADTYTLAVSVVGQGCVNIVPAGPYNRGDIVTLTAVPDPGWFFAWWEGDLNELSNPIEIEMLHDTCVMAIFIESEDQAVVTLLEEAQALIAQADAKIAEALGLLS